MNREERRAAALTWKEHMPKLLDIQKTLETLVHNPLHCKPDPHDLPFGMLNFGLEYNRSMKKIRDFEEFLLRAEFEDDWDKWIVESCKRGDEMEDLKVTFSKKEDKILKDSNSRVRIMCTFQEYF